MRTRLLLPQSFPYTTITLVLQHTHFYSNSRRRLLQHCRFQLMKKLHRHILAFFLKPHTDYSVVSSLIAQGTEFPLRKPAGFHWDIFLLGLTTGIAGLLGIPFPNGLIPQAPFHTTALCVTRQVHDESESNPNSKGHATRVVDHVVEQRVSNLAQGLLTLGTMSGPLLIVLHLIPRGVLAGLFFVMGVQALQANGITDKLLYLARDKNLTPASNPLKRLRRQQAIWYFVALELIGFGATFAITQTIAAIGFPIIILVLIPVRTFLLPKYFTSEELGVLDAPTASPFTMESVGGNFGEEVDMDGTVVPSPAGVEAKEEEDEIVERGEAAVRRRASFKKEGGQGERIEMQMVPRRSSSRRGRTA